MSNNVKYKMRLKTDSSIEKTFENSLVNDMTYWRKVLSRVVEVIKFLSSRGLALRGHDEILGSKHNGNFLGCLELLSKFDPFLAEHITRFGNRGKGRASYLSSSICDEFISIMGKGVKEKIVSEIKEARYYSFSIDSTPDVSHTDQLSLCFRYVKGRDIHERFIAFIPIEGHTADYLLSIVLNFLEESKIDMQNCKGISFDNAYNLAGIYGGLQRLIIQRNESAIFVPCTAHSLNLVGKNSVSKNITASNFFDMIEKLYGFFVYSSFRWNRLKEQLSEKGEFMLKRATGTRWSAKFQSVQALHSCYLKVLTVLNSLISEKSLSEDNKASAKGLIAKLCQFKNILMLVLWKSVLTKFNFVNLALQKPNLTLSTITKLYASIVTDLENKDYNKIFDEALTIFDNIPSDFQADFIQSRSTAQALVPEDEKENFKKSLFEPVIDALLSNLKKRADIYNDLEDFFSFLINLNSMSDEDIAVSCKKVVEKYPNDLNEVQLTDECQFAKNYFTFDNLNHESMYKTMFDDHLCETFPNLDILLRIYLCMFVTNVTDERSFSKLKLIKNCLRNTMGDDRLNSLSVLSIENNLLDELNFDEIIDKFVTLKCRKVVV
ncbi:PREDICTED: zinc finger MYM-type protein 1-like [Rhagoletis zephyria]|uniref:zinc finger MYM-type protein 1-like n=1 Tax=Rhagoletis zephyria TaxID=28612 RepID=UPI0008112677|nr:PREDICTED: zinc finger MYM-type protein 1-like [Rhagoletis zephyria]